MEGSILMYISSATILLAVFLLSWLRRRLSWMKVFLRQGMPGPKPNPLLGNFGILKDDETLFKFLREAKDNYGRTFSFCFGGTPAIFTSDVHLLQDVLVKNFDCYRNRFLSSRVHGFMQQSLLFLRDENWKRVRATLSPSFSSFKLKSMMSGVMMRRTDCVMEEIQRHIQKKEEVDFYMLFQRLTLDVIAECAFAMQINSVKNFDEARPLLNSLQSVMQASYSFLSMIVPNFIQNLLKTKKDAQGLNDFMRIKAYCQKMILERKQKGCKVQDVLQFMIDSRDENKVPLSEDTIMANTLTFLLAGYETTSTALAFTSLLLASHPDVQGKLYREITQKVGCLDDVTFDDVRQLSYLDQVWNESLRMYPPINAMFGREVTRTTTLGGFTVPAGSWVMISPMLSHNDPEYWPEPHVFRPERWEKKDIQPYSFLPFGDGPRHCIGRRFAEIEAKLALVKIFGFFELKPADDHNVHPMKIRRTGPSMGPASGSVLLTATPRLLDSSVSSP